MQQTNRVEIDQNQILVKTRQWNGNVVRIRSHISAGTDDYA